MKLGTRARYAVMALCDLALLEKQGQVASASDIAERQELPIAYLEQIFVKLRKAGLVTSTRGAQGGYKLARNTATIRISDIIYAMESAPKTMQCDKDSLTGCRTKGERCITHNLWEALEQTIHHFLSSLTLFDVIQGNVPMPEALLTPNQNHRPNYESQSHVL